MVRIFLQVGMVLLVANLASAEPYRTVGIELVESALMEVDAVLDVSQTSVQQGVVNSVLYGYDLLDFNVTEGSRVEITNLPDFKVPLFDSPLLSAKLVEEPPTRARRQKILRGLMFLQRNRALSSARYGDEEESSVSLRGGKLGFSPRVVLGSNAYSWWSFHAKNVGRRQSRWLDESWVTRPVVEDLSVGQLRPFRRRVHEFKGSFVPPPVASRYRTRRYTPRESVANWGGLVSLIKKAAEVRTQFELAKQATTPGDRADFYVSTVEGEKVFANYALEALKSSTDRSVAERLMTTIPKLLYYSDDTWETALRIVLNSDTVDRFPALESFVGVIRSFTDAECLSGDSVEAALKPVLAKFDYPTKQAALGMLNTDKVLPVIFQLYEAELKCFLTQNKIDRGALVPERSGSAFENLLHRSSNSGLSLDELGMLGPISPFSANEIRKKQRAIESFKPVFTAQALSQIARVPTGLRALIDFCAYGLENYEKIGLPDLTLGAHVTWKFSCDQLADYQWPENYCESEDSRLNRELSDYGAMMAKALLVAIENDDREFMRYAFDVVAKVPSRENADLVASVIPLTAAFFEQGTRAEFLQQLPRLPYFSIAMALAREYVGATGEHKEVLNELLERLTSAKPPLYEEGNRILRHHRWVTYLTSLKFHRKSEDDPGLFTEKALMNAIHQPPCDRKNVGWNRRWRAAELPVSISSES